MQDILNKTVGRIRAKYSRILSIDLESGKIVRVNTVFIEKITNYGPNIGVWPKLSRIYVLDIVENHYYPILNHLSSSVDGTIRVRPNEDLPSWKYQSCNEVSTKRYNLLLLLNMILSDVHYDVDDVTLYQI